VLGLIYSTEVIWRRWLTIWPLIWWLWCYL